MAVPYAAGSIFQVQLSHTLDAQMVMTTYHYRVTAGGADAQVAQNRLGSVFETGVWAVLRAGLSVELGGTRIRTQIVHPVRIVHDVRVPLNQAGVITGDCLPSGVAVVIRKRTEIAGRSHRGRVFLPGIPASGVDLSSLTTAYMTAHSTNLPAAIVATLNGFGGEEWRPVIWSKTPDPLLFDFVTTAQMDGVIRYQRRREVGVGV
jgi:hypothetical protein